MSRWKFGLAATLGFLTPFSSTHSARAQHVEDGIVRSAHTVLSETMNSPLGRIPAAMLADAHGVAIIPNMLKGGLVVGVRHGTGVLMVRDAQGNWTAPVFINLTGGNIGWQIGLQATDLVLVFKTPRSVEGVYSGKLTIGGDVAAAAGPVGRQASAGTDGRLKAEIYSYARSRGLFAGVSVDGSVLRINSPATASYYPASGPGQPATVPPAAVQLVQAVAAYSGTDRLPAPGIGGAQPAIMLPQPTALNSSDALRDQLGQTAAQLYGRLEPQWQEFLALPAQVSTQEGHPPAQQLQQCLANYEVVVRDARYRELAELRQFRATYDLLRQYLVSLTQDPPPLRLPPPPTAARSENRRY